MKILKLICLIPCFFLPLIVFLIHIFILGPLNLYSIYSWIDIPMHFFGGASIAYAAICVLKRCKNEIEIKDKFVHIIIIVSFVALIAVLWELAEFLLGFDLALKDTLFDLFMGSCYFFNQMLSF